MTTRLSLICCFCLGIFISACVAFAAESDASPSDGQTRVLIITGEDYKGHKWQETAPEVKKILEADPRFKVDVSEKAEILASDNHSDYDVIVLHFKNYKPLPEEDKCLANLKKFLTGGGGVVVLHFACGAFEERKEFPPIAGRVWDKKLGHDPRRKFGVKIVDKKHPITRGMKDFEADDELYFCLKGDREIHVLATSRSIKTGKDHPMAFVFEEGKGRVFHTPLGHDVKAFRAEGVPELIRRGTAWTAGLETTDGS